MTITLSIALNSGKLENKDRNIQLLILKASGSVNPPTLDSSSPSRAGWFRGPRGKSGRSDRAALLTSPP